jgi:hypothetical protein
MRRTIVVCGLTALVVGLALPGAVGAKPPADMPTCPIDPETGECLPPPPDRDGDGVSDGSDNCPDAYNPGQENNDGDSAGNVCDPTPNGDTPPTTSPPPPSACSGTVVLYEHVGYGGRCWSFGVGQHASIGDANDQVSSIRVAGGYVATLFPHASFVGAAFNTETTDAPWGWTGIGNDTLSSLVVQALPPNTSYSNGYDQAEPVNTAFYGSGTTGCARVGDGVLYRNSIRVHWKFNLLVSFCWDGAKVTSLYSREVAADLPPLPFPVGLVQSWNYALVDFQQGAPGYASAVLRATGRFEFCGYKIACLNTRYPWVRIELRANGTATCTNSVNGSAHACYRR